MPDPVPEAVLTREGPVEPDAVWVVNSIASRNMVLDSEGTMFSPDDGATVTTYAPNRDDPVTIDEVNTQGDVVRRRHTDLSDTVVTQGEWVPDA